MKMTKKSLKKSKIPNFAATFRRSRNTAVNFGILDFLTHFSSFSDIDWH